MTALLRRLVGVDVPSAFWPTVAASVMTAVPVGVVAPVLPGLIELHDLSSTQAGFILAAYALGRGLTTIPGGPLMERYGFRALAAVLLSAAAAVTVVGTVLASLASLMLVMLAQGLTSGVLVTGAVSAVIGSADRESAGRVVSAYQSAMLAVLLLAPAFGGVVSGIFGTLAPFWALSMLEVLGVALVLWRLPPGRPDQGVRRPRAERRQSVLRLIRSRAFQLSFLTAFLVVWTVIGVRNTLVPLFAAEELGLGPDTIGLVLTVAAVGGIAALVPSGRALDRFGRRPVIRLGTALIAIFTAMFSLVGGLVLLVVVGVAAEFSKGLLNPTQAAVVADLAGEGELATAVGISRMAAPLGMLIGPISAGWFEDVFGPRGAFLAAAAVVAAIAVVCSRMPETLGGGGSICGG